MSRTSKIDALLQSPPSTALAGQLVAWADATRDRIARSEMEVGLLSIDEVLKIPTAYQTAAQQGDPNAWITLAWWHARPDVGNADLKAAEKAMRAAIDANVATATLELAKMRWFFKRQTATKPEENEAYQLVSEVVNSDPDNADALYILALLTTHGFGVTASPKRGFELLEQSAALGNTDALFEIYIHHAKGIGVPIHEKRALQACQRAADAGHPRAMYNMGAFNAAGRGMPKDIPEAIKWYERAADAGNPSAMVGLAVIYATGDGVETNPFYAQEMFDQAEYHGLDVSHIREAVGL